MLEEPNTPILSQWIAAIAVSPDRRFDPFDVFDRFFEWFTDQWLVSRQALTLFSISTPFVIATVFLGHIQLEKQSTLLRTLAGLEGGLGSISIFFLWFGMWRYWVRLDSSTSILKTTSFFLLLFGIWFGGSPLLFLCIPAAGLASQLGQAFSGWPRGRNSALGKPEETGHRSCLVRLSCFGIRTCNSKAD